MAPDTAGETEPREASWGIFGVAEAEDARDSGGATNRGPWGTTPARTTSSAPQGPAQPAAQATAWEETRGRNDGQKSGSTGETQAPQATTHGGAEETRAPYTSETN